MSTETDFDSRSVVETRPVDAAVAWDVMDAEGEAYEPEDPEVREDRIEHAAGCTCGECVPVPPPTPDADLPGGPYSADL